MTDISSLKKCLNTEYSYLEMETMRQMFEEGYDPFNPLECKAFWRTRGIDLDNLAPYDEMEGHWSYLKR